MQHWSPSTAVALFLCGVIFLSGCWDETIIAVEIASARDSDRPAPKIDTNVEIESDSESMMDSERDTGPEQDTGTGSEPETDRDSDTSTGCGVPEAFRWTSSEQLIAAPADRISIKDPTVVHDNDRWHIYASTYSDPEDWRITYLTFTDWDEARAATQTPLTDNPNLTGYMASPQLFFFTPRSQWYLVYQTPEPAYSTSTNPGDVGSWSPMTHFMSMPDIITDSDTGGIDYWVICDDSDCYLFFTAANDTLYRARTSKSAFPDGFEGTTEIVMEDPVEFRLWEACNVYRMANTDRYLLLVSAIGAGHYFRSWTADRLDGEWTPLADTEETPFASAANVTGGDWALDGFQQGEILRAGTDETLTIDTCNMRFLFQGLVAEGETYNENAYGLGLLTDTR